VTVGYRLGVDLGTTFTAAAIEEGGRAEVVQLGDHAPQIPSAVFVREDGTLLVGEAAARRGAVQPDRMEREFKRRLGDRTPFVLGGQEFTPERLTAELLRTVVAEVQRRQGRPPERIAVTHPANWGAHRRTVLLDAVRLAGVGTVTTLTEPAAAAVHYSSTERADTGDVVAVYDLGGGTFDAAVLRKTATEFELLGTPDGVEQLGGVDFDDMVFRFVLRSLDGAAAEMDPDDAAVLTALVRLRRDCTEAKEVLSTDSETAIPVSLPGIPPTSVRLTRAELEDMMRSDVERTVRCMRRALESAEVQADDVRTVVLVGGSSRIPMVAESLGAAFGRPVTPSTQPKLAVAIGAALLAGGVLPSGPPRDAAPARTEPAEPARPSTARPAQPAAGTRSAPASAAAPRAATRPLQRATPAPTGLLGRFLSSLPRLATAILALLLLAVLVAFTGPSLRSASPPEGVLLGGTPVASEMEQSLSGTLPVQKLPETVMRATVLGLPWPSRAGTDILADQFLAGPVRLVFSGTESGEVVVRQPSPDLGVVTKVAPAVLLLFAAAYTESLLRRVGRRGRARAVDSIGMAAVGALTGFALVLTSWAVAGLDVGLLIVALVLLLAAAAGSLTPALRILLRQRSVARAQRAPSGR
jgi:actin-like ATPase involved in cell morphogenesis